VFLIITSQDENSILEKYVKACPLVSIRSRAYAILMRVKGLDIKTISSLVFKSERTITRWFKEFVSLRLASIFTGYLKNDNASKLTLSQRLEIKQLVSQPPNEYGLPKEFWDVPKIKEYLSVEFGVIYESDRSYHFLLKFCGLSFKYPDKLSPRRDEDLIKQRVKEIRAEIKPLMKDDTWLVLTSDETRIQLEAEIRRAWLVKGKRTIIKTEQSNEHQNYLGFLDQKYGVCQIFEINRGNQKETIRVLKTLVKQYPNKKICVIWDNAKWHKGKLLRQELAKGKSLEKLHLINLPPYAPEHNPIEHIWNYGKEKIKNKSTLLFSEIKQQFYNHINQHRFTYQI
jgi:transposase